MMRIIPRGAGLCILLALLLSAVGAQAQDDTITVVGSGLMTPIVEAVAESANITNINVSVTGTNSGFERFCAGEADITTATRSISASEEVTCAQNNVQYLELLVGHDILALVTSPDSDIPECLSSTELNTLFAPSAQGQIRSLNQINPEYPDIPVSIDLPGVDTSTYALLDELIEGVGLRTDVSTQPDDQATIDAVASSPDQIGVVSFSSAAAAGDSVRTLEINPAEGSGCAVPTVGNVEGRTYAAADRLLAYVNVTAMDKAGTGNLLTALTSDSAAEAVGAAGFSVPSADAQTTNADILANLNVGRQFSREATEFTIPDQIFGAITIGGSANAFDYIQTVTSNFTGTYQAVTTDVQIRSQANGLERFCNGELDIAVTYIPLSDEQNAACQTNHISFETLNLGAEAAVLVSNAASDYLACLTTDELASVWKAQGETANTTWNQVNESFPDTQIFLFAPDEGNGVIDLLMLQTAGVSAPLRPDVAETDRDPLYRAAATGNVEGALTVMNWGEYQSVLDNNQANIQLVGVDAGSGCIEPSEETIANDTYPLTRPLTLLISDAALARPEVQSLLWYMVSDENYALLTDAGLSGLAFGQLPDIRTTLQVQFSQAPVQAELDAQATPEATSEATSEPPIEAATEEVAATAEATEGAD